MSNNHSPVLGSEIEPLDEPKKRRPMRAEIQAMAKIDGILSGLDEDAAVRVVTWLNSLYNLPTSGDLPPC